MLRMGLAEGLGSTEGGFVSSETVPFKKGGVRGGKGCISFQICLFLV